MADTHKPRKKPRKRKRRKKQQKDFSQQLKRAEELTFDPRLMTDPKVQAIMLRMHNAGTNREKLEATLLLDQVLFQQHSALGDPERADEVSRARVDAEGRDVAEESFAKDSAGFIDGVFNDAEKVKLTGEAADQARANAAKMYKLARDGRMANQRVKELKLLDLIENGPRVTVNAEGHWIQEGPAGSARKVIRPDVVRIMNQSWVFNPGLNENVPKVFADRYELIRQSRAETREREDAMRVKRKGGLLEAQELERTLLEIDRRYGVSRQMLGGTA